MVSELSHAPVSEPSETRRRIMEAALETIRAVGITGVSARAIAATGGFNQALIFYHFGSVNNLLVQAARVTTSARVATYREITSDVESLTSLVDIARRLHAESQSDGSVAVLTQLMAGAAFNPEMGSSVREGFEEWIDVVESALRSALEGEPIASVVPTREAAYSIAALFLGIELIARLDPSRSEAETVFDGLHDLAALLESIPPAISRFIKTPARERAPRP